jgi:hypothetical protein
MSPHTPDGIEADAEQRLRRSREAEAQRPR